MNTLTPWNTLHSQQILDSLRASYFLPSVQKQDSGLGKEWHQDAAQLS